MDQEIEKLQKRKNQIDARIKMKKAKYSRDARKRDTKRKVLIGAGVEILVKEGRIKSDQFKKMMRYALSEKDMQWMNDNYFKMGEKK